MAKVELFVKDVDMDAVGGTAKYRASPLGDDEHLAVFDIAEASQERVEVTRLFLASGEIYVAINPVTAGEDDMVWTAPEDGYRSYQA